MSYEDDHGNQRTYLGQFENSYTVDASTGEQAMAGVNEWDTPYSARLKVEDSRRINGQDPYTGAYLPRNPATGQPVPFSSGTYADSGGGYSGGSSGQTGVKDEGQTLGVLGAVFKTVVLWPLAIATVLVALGLGATAIGRSVDGPTLAAKAAGEEFATYQPVPISARFSPKELAAPIDPAAFAAALRAHKPDKKADPKQARANSLISQAYRCMFQEGCRHELAKAEPMAAARLPYLAAGFLAPLAAKGDDSAARDMCLFAMKLGVSYQDALIARKNCAQSIYVSHQSAAAKEASVKLAESWAMRKAEAYSFLDEAQRMVSR